MYNIPVVIWILDTHPIHAPLCYVRPTPDMQIKVSKNVDGNGKIYLPYLHEWDGSNSDIIGLVQMCIITFGEEPPVFARPQGQPAPPVPAAAQQPYPPYPTQNAAFGGYPAYPPAHNPGGPGYPPPVPGYPPTSGTNHVGGAYPPPYPPVSTGMTPQGQPAGNNSTITQEHMLMSMRSAVEDMVRRKLREEYSVKNGEIQSLTKIRDELNMGQMQLKRAIDAIDRENEVMEKSIQDLKLEEDKMKNALEESEKMKDATDDKPEDAVVAPAPLYRQLVNAHAEEAAVHDAIYYLGEALKHEVIDCDVFLKQVRKMARKQFFLRATMDKCRKVAGLPA